MRWSAAVLVGCALVGSVVSSVQGAEVYRWIDGKGVAHYSQLPPSSQQQTFGRVNTAFTPAEQALIRTRRTARVAEEVTPASHPASVDRWRRTKLSQPAARQTVLSETPDRRAISELA